MKRALLIVNPYSTQVTGPSIAAVENALRERVEIETMFTQYPGHATELAAEAAADSVDAIVIFSGDGTYNDAEVAPTEGADVPFRAVITNTSTVPVVIQDLTDAFPAHAASGICAGLIGTVLRDHPDRARARSVLLLKLRYPGAERSMVRYVIQLASLSTMFGPT